MSFQLVIAEKPSVARSIAAVIGATEKQTGYWQGGGYLVSWCIGHLVSFAEAGQYDEKYCKWKYEDLPILPQPWQFIVPDEKKQQFEIVRSLQAALTWPRNLCRRLSKKNPLRAAWSRRVCPSRPRAMQHWWMTFTATSSLSP
mgnify:CR=1 FL=1